MMITLWLRRKTEEASWFSVALLRVHAAMTSLTSLVRIRK